MVDTAYYTDIYPSVDPELFYYLCTTINFDLYKYGLAVSSMTQEALSQIPFALPSDIKEQTALATHLDRKTTEIDELIADKKRLLALYGERKIAIINQAITKRLDSNVSMKDSGIEWLGEIPEHWEIKKLKGILLKSQRDRKIQKTESLMVATHLLFDLKQLNEYQHILLMEKVY